MRQIRKLAPERGDRDAAGQYNAAAPKVTGDSAADGLDRGQFFSAKLHRLITTRPTLPCGYRTCGSREVPDDCVKCRRIAGLAKILKKSLVLRRTAGDHRAATRVCNSCRPAPCHPKRRSTSGAPHRPDALRLQIGKIQIFNKWLDFLPLFKPITHAGIRRSRPTNPGLEASIADVAYSGDSIEIHRNPASELATQAPIVTALRGRFRDRMTRNQPEYVCVFTAPLVVKRRERSGFGSRRQSKRRRSNRRGGSHGRGEMKAVCVIQSRK